MMNLNLDYHDDLDLRNDVHVSSTSRSRPRSSSSAVSAVCRLTHESSEYDNGDDENPESDNDEDEVGYLDPENDNETVDKDEENTDEWMRNTYHLPKVPDFTAKPGLKFDIEDDPISYEINSLIITEDVLQEWERETNRYAKSAIDEKELRQRVTVDVQHEELTKG